MCASHICEIHRERFNDACLQIGEHAQLDPAASRDTPTGKIFKILWYNIFRIIKFFKYVASKNIWINIKVLNKVNYLLIVSQLNLILRIEFNVTN